MLPQSPRRIVVKVSGSYFVDETQVHQGVLSSDRVATFSKYIHELIRENFQIVIVVGGGNILRGTHSLFTVLGIQRTRADSVGLVSTLLNGLMLHAVIPNSFLTAPAPWCVPGIHPFNDLVALKALERGTVVICAGGLGLPFLSTDTTAVMRACELQCDLVLKATRVDGVYTSDPLSSSAYQRYSQLSYDEAIQRKLAVMDTTALTLARDNAIPLKIFNLWGTFTPAQILQGKGAMTDIGPYTTSLFAKSST